MEQVLSKEEREKIYPLLEKHQPRKQEKEKETKFSVKRKRRLLSKLK